MKFLVIGFIIGVVISCGTSTAESGYRLENIYGYTCITNDVSIWCE